MRSRSCVASDDPPVSKLVGIVDSQLRPIVRITIAGKRKSFPAWIDLGFEGELVLPFSERDRLEVETTSEVVDVVLGDGTPALMPLGRLPIRIFGRRHVARVLLSTDREPALDESSGQPLGLIGLGLLGGTRLTVDLVAQGNVVLEKPIPSARPT